MPLSAPFSFRDQPPAVRGLILLNGAVFLCQFFWGGWMTAVLGLVPARVVVDHWVWQLFTYQFLHGGVFHLLLNLYALWAFGRVLEERWGTAAFLRFYFSCALGAALLSVALAPHSLAASIGASGAIFGLLVGFALTFPDAVLYLYFLIPIKAAHAAMLFGALAFLAGFSGSPGGVANLAHLGGLATGYVYLRWRQMGEAAGEWLRARRPEPEPAARRVKPVGVFHRVVRPPETPEEMQREVDRILDKILQKGIGAISDEERAFMDRYSRLKR